MVSLALLIPPLLQSITILHFVTFCFKLQLLPTGRLAKIKFTQTCYYVFVFIFFHFQNYTGARTASVTLNSSCTYQRSCSDSPCLNGGICRPNGSCACTPQYFGIACQFFNSCSSSPCLNGGKCTANVSVPAQYTCGCPQGTGGANCQVQPCSANPCQNGGTCASSGAIYNCTCSPGYFGINCSMPVNPCSNNTCLNGGTCIGMGGSFACACPSSYTGSVCEVPIANCNNNPCANGATCIPVLPNGFTCACSAGFTGVTCLHDINECLQSPCQNGGTCANTMGSFTCTCPSSYTGPLCSYAVDFCAGQPCGHNGTCQSLPLLGTYSCSCLPGYTGLQCGTVIDQCSPFPCYNGATCLSGVNTYWCICAPGFTGALCEHDLCFSTPCSNGGTCSIANGNYVCACPSGWSGAQCQYAASVSGKLASCGLPGSLDALVASGLISSYVDTVSLPTSVQANPISLSLSPKSYGLYYSAWIWQDSNTAGNLVVFNTNTFNASLVSDPLHSLIVLYYSSPSGAQLVNFSSSQLVSSAWHHVTFAVDANGTASVSVDGTRSQQVSVSGFVLPSNATVTLVQNTSATFAFTGLMRAVAVAPLNYPQVDLYSVEACVVRCSGPNSNCNNGLCMDLIGAQRICQCYYGYTGLLCQSLQTRLSFSGMGQAQVTNVNPHSISLAFGFNAPGGLLFNQSANSVLSAALVSGSMLIKAQSCGYSSSNVSLSLGKQQWHQLQTSSAGNVHSVLLDSGPSNSLILNNATCGNPSPYSLTLSALSGGFSGCLQAVQLDGAQLNASALVLSGDATFGCSHSTAHFFDDSSLQLAPFISPRSQNISFYFSSLEPQGTMYYGREIQGDATSGIILDFLCVYLRGGHVVYTFNIGYQTNVSLQSSGIYNDGMWHRVDISMSFTVDGKGMTVALGMLSVDGGDSAKGSGSPGPLVQLDTTGPVILGGVPLDQQSQTGLVFANFYGCIQDVTQNGATTDLLQYVSAKHVSFGNCN